MLDSGVFHHRKKLGEDAVLGSYDVESWNNFTRIDPVDHSSSNWIVLPGQAYCITTTSGTTITALGVEIRWKASDLLLYDDPNSPGMAEQVSTAAVPTLTVITTANASSTGMAKQVSRTAVPTVTVITAATITISQAVGDDKHKLDTGTEIGLIVGLATLVLIVFASFIAFLFLRKRRTLNTTPGLTKGSTSSASGLVNSSAGGAYTGPIELRATSKWKAEIDSNQLSELR